MVIVDTFLQKREQDGKPILVGTVGAGHIARGVASQLRQSPGEIRLAAIANRTVAKKSVQLLNSITPVLAVVSA